MKRCVNYCGVACVDGSCPIALKDEYAERDYDIVHDCSECNYYKGCEDCAMEGTTLCKYQPITKKHIKDSTELSGGHLW